MGQPKTLLTDKLYHRASEIAVTASELAPEEREAYLEQACGGDGDLEAEVRHLVQVHGRMGGFLESPAAPRLAAAVLESAAAQTLAPGDIIEDFLICGLLGSGSAADVYHAHQISLRRDVALKVSPSSGEEARKMAHLDHEGIVKIYAESYEPSRRVRLIAMQYVHGVSFDKVLESCTKPGVTLGGEALLHAVELLASREGTPHVGQTESEVRERFLRLDYRDAILWIGARLAQSLAYAHRKGVLHLDVKPANILLTIDGCPMLTDFNIAVDKRPLHAGGTLTSFGGTPEFMSPEQEAVFGTSDRESAMSKIDERSDVYSLGIVLNKAMELRAHEERFPLLTAANPDEILRRCVQKDPALRFQTAEELARALNGCLDARTRSRALPKGGFLLRAVEKYPLAALLSAIAGGPFLSMLLALTCYAPVWPGTSASVTQDLRLEYYLLLPVLIALGTWSRPLVRLRSWLKEAKAGHLEESVCLFRRRYVLGLPWRAATSVVAATLPIAFLPLFLEVAKGTAPIADAPAFALSLALSSAIGAAFLFPYAQLIAVRALYVRFWPVGSNIGDMAGNELRAFGARTQAFHLLAGFLPLMAATVLVRADGDRQVVTVLNLLGMVGIVYALGTARIVARTIFALVQGIVRGGTIRAARDGSPK